MRISIRSGTEIPEQPVVLRSVGIRVDAVGREQLGFPTRAVILGGAPSRDCQVCLPVSDAERADVDVPAPAPVVVDQSIGAHASPWQTTSWSIGGGSVAARRLPATSNPDVQHPTRPGRFGDVRLVRGRRQAVRQPTK